MSTELYNPDPSHIPTIKEMWGEAVDKIDSPEHSFYISFGHALHIFSRLKLMTKSEADFVIGKLMEEQLIYAKNYEPNPTDQPKDKLRPARLDAYTIRGKA